MASPWEITGDDLELWAQRREAQSQLPVLVRRLLLATTPLQMIDVRGDSGVQYGGWDGEVRSRVATPWCPAGLSYWEFSVTTDDKKLNGDFKKRLASARRDATYVAVVGGRYKHPRGKRGWEGARRKDGGWADVRLFDADSLATWLGESPVTSLWMASELGRPVEDVVLPEAYLTAWSNRTEPPLPSDLLLLGDSRREAAAQLRTFALSPRGVGWVGIVGVPEDEARAFAVRAIFAERSIAERTAVVRSKHAWEWLLRTSRPDSPLVLVPDFEGASPASGRTRALTVGVARESDRSDLRLLLEDYVPSDALRERLIAFGMRSDDARNFVQRASARLADLQRLLGEGALPEWARSQPANLWVPMLLLGRWMPGYEADQHAVQRMGVDPAELERMSEALTSISDRPLRRAEDWGREVTWEWCAPEVIWDSLAPRVPSGDLRRFRGIAAEVLRTDDPRYDAPANERFAVGVMDRRSRPSAPLREGIARTLARLGNAVRGTFRAVATEGPGVAAWVVRNVLTTSWKRWASCSRELPWLAEAAPGEFLRALAASLADEGGCARLLGEGEGGIGEAPHVGLLWAIERIAWEPRWMPGCIDALTTLAARDPGGNMNPRPAATLHGILAAVAPRTAATREERLAVMRRVVEQAPEVGWSLLLAIFAEVNGGILMQGTRPEYLRVEGMPDPERFEYDPSVMDTAIQLAIREAGTDARRWKGLIDRRGAWHDVVDGPLWAAFEEAEPSIEAGRGDLWHTLRGCRATALLQEDAERVERVDRLAKRFEPESVVERAAWLFGASRFNDFSTDWRENQALEMQAREQMVSALWQTADPWMELDLLAGVVAQPWTLGERLAASPFAVGLEARLRAGRLSPGLRRVQSPFVIHGIHLQGDDWGRSLLSHLAGTGRHDEVVEALIAPFLAPRWWRLAEQVGESVAEEYWSRVRVLALRELTAEECAYASDRLLECGRGVALVNALLQPENQPVRPVSIVRALEQIAEHSDTREVIEAIREPSFPWHIEQAFLALDQANDIPPEVIAGLEMRLLGPVHASGRSARALQGLLSARPDWFVDLLRLLYRAEGDPAPTQVDEAAQHRAKVAWRVLHEWRGFPGDTAQGEERELKIEAWAEAVFEKSATVGRGRVARSEVGEVLARVPAADDGEWPSMAARRLLEREPDDELARAIEIGKRNARGVTSRAMGEGGEQERHLASQYRSSAQRLRASWPRTAAMLDELADSYEHDAEREDASARTQRERWGIDPARVKRTPMTEPSSEPAPSRPVEVLFLHGMSFAAETIAPLGARMTLLVGDNSAGKSVVLDALWWALTGSWTRDAHPVVPDPAVNGSAKIGLRFADGGEHHARFDPKTERWQRPEAWKGAGALVVYARIDGGYSVYEPVQGAVRRLSVDEVFDGQRADGASACNGLIEDVPTWQVRLRRLFDAMNRALAALSPPGELLAFGDPVRASVHDAREIPTVALPYGHIPVTRASASVKRVASLAYTLLWAWREHQETSRIAQEPTARNVVVLVDEIEAHLHPEWQRGVLPGLLEALDEVSRDVSVQTVVVTHSPLVVASAEPIFERSKDKLLHMGLRDGKVSLEDMAFEKEGDIAAWLTSPAFGLRSTRSVPAEAAIARAQELAASADATAEELRAANMELTRVLSPTDPFFVRWDHHLRRKGVAP
ncbi:MAG: AAA family ATPase [Polyangiales bacterium]